MHRELAAVIAGQGGVERHRDGLAPRAADDGRDDVALLEGRAGEGVVGVLVLPDIGRHALRTRSDAVERDEPVAAVDVEQLCDRAELVGRVIVAVAGQIIAHAVVVVLLGAVGELAAQVVAVAARAVRNLAEDALPHHVRHHQLAAAVAAVFKQHAGHAGLLRGVHERPAVLEVVGAADLDPGVNAGAHGLAGEGDVGDPVRENQHGVDVEREQLGIDFRRDGGGQPVLFHALAGGFDAVVVEVADADDLQAAVGAHGHEDLVEQGIAPHTEPDNGNANANGFFHDDSSREFGIRALRFTKCGFCGIIPL